MSHSLYSTDQDDGESSPTRSYSSVDRIYETMDDINVMAGLSGTRRNFLLDDDDHIPRRHSLESMYASFDDHAMLMSKLRKAHTARLPSSRDLAPRRLRLPREERLKRDMRGPAPKETERTSAGNAATARWENFRLREMDPDFVASVKQSLKTAEEVFKTASTVDELSLPRRRRRTRSGKNLAWSRQKEHLIWVPKVG